MQKIIFLSILLVTSLSCGKSGSNKSRPHLDRDLTAEEYQKLLESAPPLPADMPDAEAVEKAIAMGERVFKLQSHFSDRSVSGTHSQIKRGSSYKKTENPSDPDNFISPDEPLKYSASLVKSWTNAALIKMSSGLRRYLLGELSLEESNLSYDEFVAHLGGINFVYSIAARTKIMSGYLDYLKTAKARDVRGYDYLRKLSLRESILGNLEKAEKSDQKKVKTALSGLCQNSGKSRSDCEAEIQSQFELGKLEEFYQKYLPYGKGVWDSFFKIPDWGKHQGIEIVSEELIVPFKDPGEKYREFIKVNIEDEFLYLDFGVKVDLKDDALLNVKFEKGVTPNVSRLGGDQITMDANQDVTDPRAQRTIRHEFGHVLGFPDCYHEFFDEEEGVFVNYQLDSSNIMCAGSGNMNWHMYKELKRVYEKAVKISL